MKQYRALKEKKNLIGEITKLKQQIKEKNSYLEGSKNGENFNAEKAYEELLSKISELSGLKVVINEANREIQARIYLIAEYKALIVFWNEVSVVEGTQITGYSDKVTNYKVKFTEIMRDKMVNEFQKKVDAIQEELDEYNFNTDIPWGDMTDSELEVLETNIVAAVIEEYPEKKHNDTDAKSKA
jgi:hypothetical protein